MTAEPSTVDTQGTGRAVLTLLAVVTVGTAAAFAADRALGAPDGHPPLHVLVLLALPFWDALPARPARRVAATAALTAAVALLWLLLGGLRPEPAWRDQLSFGLACALVGAAQLALSSARRRRRTVGP